ncbi:MAG: hypothetical protein K9L30_01080 [Desulfobacterales bacterium]|nr:hypothetical protein [Desulfobacterales bacterium]
MPAHFKNLTDVICLSATVLVLSFLLILPAFAESIPYPDCPRISTGDLKKKLNDSKLIIVDVRVESQWQSSDVKISGAVHENPADIKWADKYSKDSLIVTY